MLKATQSSRAPSRGCLIEHVDICLSPRTSDGKASVPRLDLNLSQGCRVKVKVPSGLATSKGLTMISETLARGSVGSSGDV